jgi:hypothetical protein
MTEPITWTIHAVIEDDELPPMFVIAANDYTDGFVVGELPQVETLVKRLNSFLADKKHDGEIDDLDPMLVRWLNARQAADEYNVAYSSITWACRQGLIHKAKREGRQWWFPERTFRHWLRERPGSGRRKQSK